jgi:hypothetical protein
MITHPTFEKLLRVAGKRKPFLQVCVTRTAASTTFLYRSSVRCTRQQGTSNQRGNLCMPYVWRMDSWRERQAANTATPQCTSFGATRRGGTREELLMHIR